ncbi:unnamed protein product [Psylliodes chrysocephalus]|uniref:Uncharacterized protein n=1 Tax=Psylliodes chrysocephalus TaxID=3402493 RepID=A0A9P0DAX2_9CUCU|nr:unnamed protein product [Psylliodes chrysocephala]
MPSINSSPTFYNIVYETLAIVKEVADQCHQDQIIVTYDLAIAKMAMHIQSVENPKFNGLFINLGGFHMQLAFFKAVGKAVSPKVCDFLTNASTMGHQQKLQFLEECASSPDRFEKPIKRNTVLNSASDCIKKVRMVSKS